MVNAIEAPGRMQSTTCFSALSGDAVWLAGLRDGGFRGRVHSVFERIVNMQSEGAELFTIARCGIDNAPNTLVANATRPWSALVGIGERVLSSTHVFQLGRHVQIRFDAAAAWNALRTRYPANDARLRHNITLAREVWSSANACNAHGSMDRASSIAATAPALLETRWTALRDAIDRHDCDAMRTRARALIGLGPGLTPSGDDFLVGLFAVLHIDASPCAHLRDVCAEIIEAVDERTNAISAAALKAAAQGRVRESIDALLTELMTGDDHRVLASLRRVLAIGSTSGADIVAGILAGFDANLHATESRSARVDG
jgi:hypothetical protein